MTREAEQWLCEMGIGIETRNSVPVVIMCRKPASLRGVAAVCDECWERYQLKAKEKK